VDAFGIDHSHFTGQRRWSDRQLVRAVESARTWREVMEQLGLIDNATNLRAVRTHLLRLRVDASHLNEKARSAAPRQPEPQLAHLRTAGPTLAAAWFMLRGYHVLWPLEPCRYDLAVQADGAIQRIQVKTATYCDQGTFMAQLANSRRAGHRELYDVDEIDSFFVIDAQLNAYLIPFADVAGYRSISLRNYRAYLVGETGNWLRNPTT
jgi:PD-(D/E)XK endonuclease